MPNIQIIVNVVNGSAWQTSAPGTDLSMVPLGACFATTASGPYVIVNKVLSDDGWEIQLGVLYAGPTATVSATIVIDYTLLGFPRGRGGDPIWPLYNRMVDMLDARLRALQSGLAPGVVVNLPASTQSQAAALIAGKTPSAALPLFSTRNDATLSYVRNAGFWAGLLDLTCASVSNSANLDGTGGNRGAGTAISPRHVVFANHFTPGNGTVLRFVTRDNQLVTRTLANSVQIGSGDIQVGVLDSDLPPTITPAKVIAPPVPLLTGAIVVALNQYKQGLVMQTVGDGGAANIFPTGPFTDWDSDIIVGDSGSPTFLLTADGTPVLLFCFFTGGAGAGGGAGPSLSGSYAAINTAMTNLGSGYQLTPYALPTTSVDWPNVANKPAFSNAATIPAAVLPGDGQIPLIDPSTHKLKPEIIPAIIPPAITQLSYDFGTGEDGDATLDGSATVPWATGPTELPGGNVSYVLTRPVALNNLTISGTNISVDTNGFPVFVRGTLSVAVSCNIKAQGANQANAGTSTAIAAVGGWFPRAAGGNAGAGSTGASNPGSAGQTVSTGYGGAGGAGGGTSGGAAGAVTNKLLALWAAQSPFGLGPTPYGGAGGGGGASGAGDGTNAGGRGGAGGQGGGVLFLAAYAIVGGGSIIAKGQAGAKAAAGAGGTAAPGASGGGGGGGLVYVISGSFGGTITYSAAGGVAGAAVSGGPVGAAGANGFVKRYNMNTASWVQTS